MKTITEQLVEASNGILKIQPEVRDETGFYHMFDDGGVEVEVGEFLYGLVRLLQPEKVLTTGIYTGISDLYIAQALKENGHGASTAIEIEGTHILRAKELWTRTGVFIPGEYRLKVFHGSSLEFHAEDNIDLMFLDSEPGIRFTELVRFFPSLKEGGYVGIHDLPNSLCQGNVNPDHPEMKSYPYGDLPEQIKEWLKTDKLRMIHFPSPRGLTFFYKVKEGDYKP